MVSVILKSGESPEQLLKRFRKKVQREQVLSDIRKKRFFISKSERKRIALSKAKRRERKRQRRMEKRRRRW